MRRGTAWVVTGALGVAGAVGGAVAVFADRGETDLGEGVSVVAPSTTPGQGTAPPPTDPAPTRTTDPTDPADVPAGSANSPAAVSAASPQAPDDD